MRRWNGWGDETITYPLTTSTTRYLESLLGPGVPSRDISLEAAIASVPPSKLPEHPLISVDPLERLLHARGQSLPDWVALRSGQIDVFPDGIAYPTTSQQVHDLIHYAQRLGAHLIPYGGGTSVVGHINPIPDKAPILTVDMRRMNRLLHFDNPSLLATFGAGIVGPDLEAQLRARGCTLGHFPQSFEYSTLGGWVATRSSGQQSLRYGRIERLFSGGMLETPSGTLPLPPPDYSNFPASAAGPDLRELVLGSEGRLGILTEITVRASPLPEQEAFPAVFFPDFDCAQDAVRQIVQSNLPLSMLRLSTANETITTLALAGHENLIGALEKLLAVRGLGQEKCLLLLGFTGNHFHVQTTREEALGITRAHSGVHIGKRFGSQWQKSRFRTPYLRNTLWELGYAVDTLETATDWANVPRMIAAIEGALHSGLAEVGEQVHVFSHLSHCYPYGSSIYTTYLFRLASEPMDTLQRWQILKASASREITSHGGTISHQHGVGLDHVPYLPSEKSPLGMGIIQGVCRTVDPQGIMNPGKLFQEN